MEYIFTIMNNVILQKFIIRNCKKKYIYIWFKLEIQTLNCLKCLTAIMLVNSKKIHFCS